MDPELIWVAPFVLLLASIAVFPLWKKTWWEKNYPWVSLSLAAIIVLRYFWGLHNLEPLLQTAREYFSFIMLIGSLFVVAGGIHLNVKGEATPMANCLFLFVASLLSNLIGTTGASMLFVRPWLRMNKYRLTAHHVVFFIFLVSNVGGALTPVGDPPLFLGYLKGVPFFWVLKNLWSIWLLTVLILLAQFAWLDTRNFMKAPKEIRRKETAREQWRFDGLHNLFFLALILAAVFIHRPLFLREGLMGLAAFLSYKTTPKPVHESNDFNFGPIREVAILFLGIFATMVPALQWLELHASAIGIKTAGQFFWGSGILSSVLDNAPTYLNFLSAAVGLYAAPGALAPGAAGDHAQVALLLSHHAAHIRAISVGSVFFGAMTYIGNGPNFLVKSLAEQFKAKTPSFFGYIIRYSLPILLPVFFLVWLLFFK